MTAPTPAQAAYEAAPLGWVGKGVWPAAPYSRLDPEDRKFWGLVGSAAARAAQPALTAERDALREQLAKVRAIAFRPGMSHMLKLRALHELLDPTLRPAEASADDLRTALASLADRAEASRAITGDEADGCRKLTAKGGADARDRAQA